MRKWLLAIIFLWPPAMAVADHIAKPPELSSYIQASRPLGEGELTRLWFKGYDATLWTDASEWSAHAPYALSLRYAMNFTRDELVETSIEEISRIYGLPENTLNQYGRQLSTIFPDVHKNDVITALFLPSKGTLFFHNGMQIGHIHDTAFAEQFLGIWLSPHTSEPKLRQALLGRQGA